LDGTLAHYSGWAGADVIGLPVAAMVAKVKTWRARGVEVRIFTARVWSDGTPQRDADAAAARAAIEVWCLTHLGELLPITNIKDYGMVTLHDDRAVRIVANTGEPCCDGASVPSSVVERLLAENVKLRDELERERVRLAACGVLAQSNTNESLARNTMKAGDYGHSASADDVTAAVAREIYHREKAERYRAALSDVHAALVANRSTGEVSKLLRARILEMLREDKQ
jgi:hypothetical protein